MQEPGGNSWRRSLGLVGGVYLIQSRAQGSLRGREKGGETRKQQKVCGLGFFFFFFVIFGCVGLRCCLSCGSNVFSSCGVRGLLSVAEHGLLIVAPSLFSEHGL